MKTWQWVVTIGALSVLTYELTKKAPPKLMNAQISSVVYNAATKAWDIYVTKVYWDGTTDQHVLVTSIPGAPDTAPAIPYTQGIVSTVLQLPSNMVSGVVAGFVHMIDTPMVVVGAAMDMVGAGRPGHSIRFGTSRSSMGSVPAMPTAPITPVTAQATPATVYTPATPPITPVTKLGATLPVYQPPFNPGMHPAMPMYPTATPLGPGLRQPPGSLTPVPAPTSIGPGYPSYNAAMPGDPGPTVVNPPPGPPRHRFQPWEVVRRPY